MSLRNRRIETILQRPSDPRPRWTQRLWWRVYLAVLGGLLLSALLLALTARIQRNRWEVLPPAGLGAMATALLPPATADARAQRIALAHWRRQLRLDMALYAPDGHLIGTSGDAPPIAMTDHRIPLADGRTLAVRPRLDGATWGFLALPLAILLAVALAAYPLTRRITRRLERLQHSVETFGSGELGSRVAMEGHDEIARLACSFNRAADRIEALLRAQKDLLANASHELRSPLARLRMAVELLDTSAQPALADELSRNIGELDALISELLLTSRLDAAAARIERIPVDLSALAAEECSRVGAMLHTEPCDVRSDARLLRQLIRNLLENAQRYGVDGTTELHIERLGDRVVLDILDRGPGIPEAERERIFEPFYRMPGHRERDGGVGLGLSLVRQIARSLGGDVRVLPRVGGGACFHVDLPRDDAEDDPPGP